MQLIAEQLRSGEIDVSDALRRAADKRDPGHLTDILRLSSQRAEFYEREITELGLQVEMLETVSAYMVALLKFAGPIRIPQ